MKASELRIGNLVSLPMVEYFKIRQIDLNENSIYDGALKPIPLTEEWLKRLGFKRTKESKDVEWYSFNSFDIAIHEEDNNVYIVFQHLVLKHITKVHQLQNLYFALTNKELTIRKQSQPSYHYLFYYHAPPTHKWNVLKAAKN